MMKVFQTLKEHIEFLTGYKAQEFQVSQRCNMRIAWLSSMLVLPFLQYIAFFLFEAKTLEEFANLFYLITSVFIVILSVFNLMWNINKFFELCDHFDGVIQGRGESF